MASAITRRAGRHVLHLFGWFRPEFTGEGRYVESIAPLLAAQGVVNDVAVTATRAPAELPVLPGIRAVHYFGHGFHGPGRINLPLLWWLLWHVRDYDVVHLHAQIDRYFLPQLIARLAGRRVIQSCTLADGMGSLLDSYRGFWRFIPRMLIGCIDMVVAISLALRDDNLRVLPPQRVVLIPQGVFLPPETTTDRAAARARWGIGPDDCVLLFVGGLCARKGVRTLVDAMPGLLADTPRLRLLIVGPDLEPDYAAGLRAAAAPLGDAVIFAGFQERATEFYRLADMLVFASYQEGFSNVLLEAMASRLPVICRRLPGGTDWILDDGKLGLLFDDDAEYPALVRRLAADPAARAALAAAGRRKVEQQFEMSTVAARYVALYENATTDQING